MFVEANDVEYHVQIVGEGAPFLLLHGFTGSVSTWKPFWKIWEGHRKLIMVDLIGHGKTECPEDYHRYRMEHVVADLKEILNTLAIKKVDILGYSMGGRVALSFAMLHPEKVNSLILESSSPGLHTEEERLQRKQNDQKLATKIEQEGIEAFVDYWEKIPLFSTQQARLSNEQKLQLRMERMQQNPTGLANSLRGMGTGVQPSWWERLSELTMPILLLVGELDQKFCQLNKKMQQKMMTSQLMVVKNAGHAIHVEQRDFFGKIIKGYIEEPLHSQNK